jgi:hypothetical protein
VKVLEIKWWSCVMKDFVCICLSTELSTRIVEWDMEYVREGDRHKMEEYLVKVSCRRLV